MYRIFFALLPFLAVAPALAQFESKFFWAVPGEISTDQSVDAATSLGRLRQYVATYSQLEEEQRQQWYELVQEPAADAVMPVDATIVEWLYALVESEELSERPYYWSLANHAYNSLDQVVPNQARLVDLARSIPRKNLPALIDRAYLWTLIAAYSTLLIYGSPEDEGLVIEAEGTDFWLGRFKKSQLSTEISSDTGAGQLLIKLRYCAAFAMIATASPRRAYVQEILVRKDESQGYKSQIEWLLSHYGATSNASGPDAPVDLAGAAPSLFPSNPKRNNMEGAPLLSYDIVSRLQPSLDELLQNRTINESTYRSAQNLRDEDSMIAARLDGAREVIDTPSAPRDLRRWASLSRILLAGTGNQPTELDLAVRQWFDIHSSDPSVDKRLPFGEDGALYASVVTYLANVYTHVANESFSWSPQERVSRLLQLTNTAFAMEDIQPPTVYAQLACIESLRIAASGLPSAGGAAPAIKQDDVFGASITYLRSLETNLMERGSLRIPLDDPLAFQGPRVKPFAELVSTARQDAERLLSARFIVLPPVG